MKFANKPGASNRCANFTCKKINCLLYAHLNAGEILSAIRINQSYICTYKSEVSNLSLNDATTFFKLFISSFIYSPVANNKLNS